MLLFFNSQIYFESSVTFCTFFTFFSKRRCMVVETLLAAFFTNTIIIFNLVYYGCSFVAKLSWKKKLFWKNICVFYKIYIICRKKCFYMERKFYIEKFFYWTKLFLQRKIWKCKKHISHLRNIFLYRKSLCYK